MSSVAAFYGFIMDHFGTFETRSPFALVVQQMTGKPPGETPAVFSGLKNFIRPSIDMRVSR